MLKFYTAQYNYKGSDRLDITVAGKDPIGMAFAPTWLMVTNLKKGKISEDEYEREYHLLMQGSYNTNYSIWREVLNSIAVTLVCFCPPGAFCHRLILASYLEKLGAVHVCERNLSVWPAPDMLGNILDVEQGIVCHQVNCRGVMGAGIAKSIRNKWPWVYEAYVKAELRLGLAHLVKVGENLLVANLCGQYNYGRDKKYTDYMAVRKALRTIANWRKLNEEITGVSLPIYVPYKMGCSNAGGDWYLVHNIVKDVIPDAVIVKL